MKTLRNCLWALMSLLLVGLPGAARGQELSDEARIVFEEHQKAADAIQAKADAELAVLREKTIPKLKVLQDKYCKAARLDEAVAIRDAIRQMSGVRPDPGVLHATRDDIGKSYLYEVVGALEGQVWGSELYTSDSHLAAAAVHAGVLKPGEKGVVRVRIVQGQKSYPASTRNGVTSLAWGPWEVSFTVERPKAAGGN